MLKIEVLLCSLCSFLPQHYSSTASKQLILSSAQQLSAQGLNSTVDSQRRPASRAARRQPTQQRRSTDDWWTSTNRSKAACLQAQTITKLKYSKKNREMIAIFVIIGELLLQNMEQNDEDFIKFRDDFLESPANESSGLQISCLKSKQLPEVDCQCQKSCDKYRMKLLECDFEELLKHLWLWRFTLSTKEPLVEKQAPESSEV